jgi:hypothetical protein
MPQKKNPDVPELIGGKTGRVYGHLQSLLTMIKGVPLAYNKDFQEDKEPIFDTVDTISSCLKAMTILLNEGIEFNVEKLMDSVHNDFSNATDLADYLVFKNVPFREAYQVVGDIVKYCLSKNILFKDLKLEEFLDVNYIPPTSIAVEDTGTLVSIVRPSRLLGPVADEDGNEEVPKGAGLGYASAIVAMNEYMKYYMFKKPDKSEWDTQHLARLEFLDDIKTSKSGCLNISVHLYVDIAPGQLDKNGQVCVKDEPLTHNLFLFDERLRVL